MWKARANYVEEDDETCHGGPLISFVIFSSGFFFYIYIFSSFAFILGLFLDGMIDSLIYKNNNNNNNNKDLKMS